MGLCVTSVEAYDDENNLLQEGWNTGGFSTLIYQGKIFTNTGNHVEQESLQLLANYLTYKDYGIDIADNYLLSANAIVEDDYVSSTLLNKIDRNYVPGQRSKLQKDMLKKYDDLTDYFNQKTIVPKSLELQYPPLQKHYEYRYKDAPTKSLKSLNKGDSIFIDVALTMKDKKWGDVTIPVEYGKWEVRDTTAAKNIVISSPELEGLSS